MEVFRKGFGWCLIVLLIGCGKTVNSVNSDANSAQGACSNARIPNQFLVLWEDGHVSHHHEVNVDKFIENFVKPNLEKIKSFEFDKVIHTDINVSSYGTIAAAPDWGQTMSKAPDVWAQGFQGQSIIVGVTDTGIDYSHPQIWPRLAVNDKEYNGKPGIDDDGNGYVDDIYGWNFNDKSPNSNLGPDEEHATHVAGIIAADLNTGSIKGMAPKAQIVPAKFLDGEGYGSTSGAIAALNYAVSRGARIINASWGGPQCSVSLEQTFNQLSQQGILLVVAAGNDGHSLDTYPDYPAVINAPNQITVSASRSDGYMAAFSNTSYIFSNIVAPGENILSLKPGNSTQYMSGTSMATPFVSGAAALIWSAKPNASAAQVKQALLNAVDLGPYRVSSQGRLNVRKALDELKKLVP